MSMLRFLTSVAMKKIFAFAAAAAMILGVGACQKEGPIGGRGEECVTSFTVQLPQAGQTKTVSEAENVDVVYYEIWDKDFANILGNGYESIYNGRLEKEFVLVKNQTYNFIFWAQKKSVKDGFQSPYSWENLKNVNVNYDLFTENNKDCYDAFYAVAENVVVDGTTKYVYLTRPFAQLNFGASRMDTSMGSFTIDSNTVTVKQVATVFDTRAGMASSTNSKLVDVTFVAEDGGLVQDERTDHKDLMVGTTNYYWVSMNYLLVPAEKEANVLVDATFETSLGTVAHSINSVPVQKNYRTNIVGDIFTNDSKFIIEIVPGFKDSDYIIK